VVAGVDGGMGAVPQVVSIFTGKTAGAAFVIALVPALAIPLLVAVFHQRHADVRGIFGPLAYGVNLIGLGLFSGAVFTEDTALFYLTTAETDHAQERHPLPGRRHDRLAGRHALAHERPPGPQEPASS